MRVCALLLVAATLARAASAAPAPKLPPAPAAAVQGRFVLPLHPVWAGEVFDLALEWRVDWSLFRNLEGDAAWTPAPLVADAWAPPAFDHMPPASGTERVTLRYTTRAMALAPGSVTLAPVAQAMSIVTGGYVTDGVSISTTGSVLARSAAGTLTVRPLPPPPQGFGGAVGHFTLTSSVDKKQVKAGDPVRWTLTLAGKGNWQAFAGLPPRQLDRAFDVAGKPELDEGKDPALFERTVRETVTVVPRQAGNFQLGPVEIMAFDPAEGRYVQVRAPALKLEVRANPLLPPPRYEAEPPAGSGAEALPPLIEGVGTASVPLSQGLFRAAAALPFAALTVFWLVLAFVHALAADPDRAARAARRRLVRTLGALGDASDEVERRRLIRAWQRDTGAEWKLDRAAPTPSAFVATNWRRAWTEAETYLYGPEGCLPDDWLDRARALHEARPAPPPFALRVVFARRHLLPLASLVALLVAGYAMPVPAAAPSGSLEQRVQQRPLDWIARYDLARRDAIARRWERAAVGAGIASVQRPGDANVRALWLRSAREAGVGGTRDGGLPQREGATEQLAGLAAPAAWQAFAISAAWTLAIGCALLLAIRFKQIGRRLRVVGMALICAAALTGATSAIALSVYGLAAYPESALTWHDTPLRALPVDTPADEAPVRLGSGLLARPDRAFLGWRHIHLADGRDGWLREDQLLPLWRAAPATVTLMFDISREAQP